MALSARASKYPLLRTTTHRADYRVIDYMSMAEMTEWSGQKFLLFSYSYLLSFPYALQLTFWSFGVLLPVSPMDEKNSNEYKILTHKNIQEIKN